MWLQFHVRSTTSWQQSTLQLRFLSHANVHHSKKKAGSVVKSTGIRHWYSRIHLHFVKVGLGSMPKVVEVYCIRASLVKTPHPSLKKYQKKELVRNTNLSASALK